MLAPVRSGNPLARPICAPGKRHTDGSGHNKRGCLKTQLLHVLLQKLQKWRRKRVFFVFCAINTRLFFKNSILRQPLRSLHSNLFFSSFPPLILFPETSSKHPLQNLRDKICDKVCNKIHHTGSLPVPIPRDTPISRPLRPCHGFLSATGFAHHPSRGRRTP